MSSGLHRFFQRVIEENAPGLLPTLVRALLLPLSWLYGGFIELYKALFRWRVLRIIRLPCRVVSIGNLTLGGVGKSVAIARIAQVLQRQGIRCAVVCYGYAGESRDAVAVVSDGENVLLPAASCGDEPVMLAEALPGVPVLVSRRRALGGQEAVERFQPEVLLLDDGFQHWRLYRDTDIVLLDARKPLGNGRVFPAGTLRERAPSLRRAHHCILTRCDLASERELEAARRLVRRLHGQLPDETAHGPGPWRRVAGSGASAAAPAGPLAPAEPPPGPVLVVSGIAQNESFAAALRRRGLTIRRCLFYADHHTYTSDDVLEMKGAAANCAAVVTTAKDAVKLRDLWGPGGPLYSAGVELQGISDARLLELTLGRISVVPGPEA